MAKRKITEQFIKEVQDDLDAKVRKVLKKHRLIVGKRSGTYNMQTQNGDFTWRWNTEDSAQLEFEQECRNYKLEPADYNRTIVDENGMRYQIVAIKASNRNFPIIGCALNQSQDRKKFKPSFVLDQLHAQRLVACYLCHKPMQIVSRATQGSWNTTDSGTAHCMLENGYSCGACYETLVANTEVATVLWCQQCNIQLFMSNKCLPDPETGYMKCWVSGRSFRTVQGGNYQCVKCEN
jgi:hypothetical protein